MKKKKLSEEGSPLRRRSARLSSPTYKPAPAPLQWEPTATTIRRWFKTTKKSKPKPKPKSNPNPNPKPKRRVFDTSFMSKNWEEAHRAKSAFEHHRKSISRKSWSERPGPGYDELTCIFPSGDTFTWLDKSRGTTWIALRGPTTYLVLFMDPNSELKSFVNDYPRKNYILPKRTLLATLDEMGDSSSTFNQMIALHSQGNQGFPFAVVSIAPETFKDFQERKQAASRAIESLMAKLFDRSDITFQELVMIGLCALNEMFGPNFRSNDIEQVSYQSMHWGMGFGRLSSYDVDEWLKEIKAEPSKNDNVRPESSSHNTASGAF